jgi:hypothetical protein
MRTWDGKTVSELVQCGLEHPVKHEVCFSYGEHSYDEWKETVWISVKSDCKECVKAIGLCSSIIKSGCNRSDNKIQSSEIEPIILPCVNPPPFHTCRNMLMLILPTIHCFGVLNMV